YAPLRLIIREARQVQRASESASHLRVILANDTAGTAVFELEYGYISFDGSVRDIHTMTIHAPALTRTDLLTFPRGDYNPAQGVWFARASGTSAIPAIAIFRAADYRKLQIANCELRIATVTTEHTELQAAKGEYRNVIRVSAGGYAHAVHFMLPGDMYPEDNYFDLLPDEVREVVIISRRPLTAGDITVTCVNHCH
ncbi:MAG: hypothetical protein JXA33_10500, partial [Anaerolineae bacterium]|nr:hypothetical protein [Anaerolineae bacterium]